MAELKDESQILEHFRLDLRQYLCKDVECEYYLLLCGRSPVTVRSQQVRAMNLAWALRKRLPMKSTKVVVIGGGAAGLTFAATAALLGAKVDLFEKAQFMHLQQGCWHRPLHPDIYAWPDDTAFRPVSHLPLGWTTGPAHEVVQEIVGKFMVLEGHSREILLTAKPNTPAMLLKDGRIKVMVRKGDARNTEYCEGTIVVLAVGFGHEHNRFYLPNNSYWRADALDQSFLDEEGPTGDDFDEKRTTVVVTGSGDGGLIEVLRSCVQRADQGPFLDKVLSITLQDPELRKKIGEFDRESTRPRTDDGRADGKAIQRQYEELEKEFDQTLTQIDQLLLSNKRRLSVKWLIREANPFDFGTSLPVNRFLASRLLILAGKKEFDLTLIPNAKVTSVDGPLRGKYRGKYKVSYEQEGAKPASIVCRLAVARWGPEKFADEDEASPFRSVTDVFDRPCEEFIQTLGRFINEEGKHPSTCNQATLWERDDDFNETLNSKRLPRQTPTLYAEFVQSFPSRDPVVYRIRIWLEGVPKHLSVRYDLHPETNKPITRVGIDDKHELWINTWGDYGIRVRTSDGLEWNVGTVLQALKQWRAVPQERGGPEPGQRIHGKLDGQPFLDETVDEAVRRIEEQTARSVMPLQMALIGGCGLA